MKENKYGYNKVAFMERIITKTKMAIMIIMIAIISIMFFARFYFNANLMVSAKASGIKLISGIMSSSGFQSSERFTGALVNL